MSPILNYGCFMYNSELSNKKLETTYKRIYEQSLKITFGLQKSCNSKEMMNQLGLQYVE